MHVCLCFEHAFCSVSWPAFVVNTSTRSTQQQVAPSRALGLTLRLYMAGSWVDLAVVHSRVLGRPCGVACPGCDRAMLALAHCAALPTWACRRCCRTPPSCTAGATKSRQSSSHTAMRITLVPCPGCGALCSASRIGWGLHAHARFCLPAPTPGPRPDDLISRQRVMALMAHALLSLIQHDTR